MTGAHWKLGGGLPGLALGHMMSGLIMTALSGYVLAAGALLAVVPAAMFLFRHEGVEMEILLALAIGAAFGAVLDRIGASEPNNIGKMLNLTIFYLMKTFFAGNW